MCRTRVKICGVTRSSDAITASRAGADAIGIILFPGAKRFVTVERATAVLAVLPPYVTPVGLFVDAAEDEIRATCRRLGLRHIQLHGGESVDAAARLSEYIIVKAIRVDASTLAADLGRWRHPPANVRGIVLETANTGQHGGSGVANDWDTAREALDRGLFDGLPPIIAAGGLTPANVGAVIRKLRPWAVDVSSGVEETSGTKSERLIADFVNAARDVD